MFFHFSQFSSSLFTIYRSKGLRSSTPWIVNLVQNGGSSRELHADWLGVGGKELCRRVVSDILRSRGGFALALTTLAAFLQPLLPRRMILFIIHVFLLDEARPGISYNIMAIDKEE